MSSIAPKPALRAKPRAPWQASWPPDYARVRQRQKCRERRVRAFAGRAQGL